MTGRQLAEQISELPGWEQDLPIGVYDKDGDIDEIMSLDRYNDAVVVVGINPR